jgi:hypothetical protein
MNINRPINRPQNPILQREQEQAEQMQMLPQ